jgi:sulfotransferase family protein
VARVEGPDMALMPTFLVIGAAKSGTSSFYMYLAQHPQIYMSPRKEPHFFAYDGEKLDFRGPPGVKLEINQSITDIAKYQRLFAKAPPGAERGEASVVYLYEPKAVQRIRHYIPDAKLIAILRNPIERAFSAYLHVLREGREPARDFIHALDMEPARIQERWPILYRYVDAGRYACQLDRYFQAFRPAQLRIYLYDDLRSDPVAVAQDCFRFLGIDPAFVPDVRTHYNESGVPRSPLLHSLLRGPDSLKRLKRTARLYLGGGHLHSTYVRLKSRNLVRPTIPAEASRRLKVVFEPEISRLQSVVGQDLSRWLR